MKKQALIIFVKNPELGKVKTRLASTIGAVKALEVYRLLLEKTMRETKDLTVDKYVFYSEFNDQKDLFSNDCYQKQVQASGDLGVKMDAAFRQVFEMGYEQVGIIGSDCYQLTNDILAGAFRQLEKKDVVIGPAKDGGYYFIGMNKHYPFLFQDKAWSTDSVFQSTLQDIMKHDLSSVFLKDLSDIDEEGDLLSMGWDNPLPQLPKN